MYSKRQKRKMEKRRAAKAKFKHVKQVSKKLLRNPTKAELDVLMALRSRGLYPKFQYPVIKWDKRLRKWFGYVVDFSLNRKGRKPLIIEIDGGYHNQTDQTKKDWYRERRLQLWNKKSVDIIRFTNEEVFKNLDGVINRIINVFYFDKAALSIIKQEEPKTKQVIIRRRHKVTSRLEVSV